MTFNPDSTDSYWYDLTCPEFVGDEGPQWREDVESQSVEEEEDSSRDQECQPEPEKQVELLVDDVVGKHTDRLQ